MQSSPSPPSHKRRSCLTVLWCRSLSRTCGPSWTRASWPTTCSCRNGTRRARINCSCLAAAPAVFRMQEVRSVNSLERKMVDVLIDLRENHFVNGVKAEFEAEGTRLEEAMRLKEVVSAAGIGLTIKIGGCEALRDMYECRVLG